MKTIQLRYRIYLTLISIFFFSFCTQAQEKKETFEKSYTISADSEFSFSCYDTDLKINTWNKNEVKLFGEILIKGGKEDDHKILLDLFKSPDAKQTGNTLEIKTNISKSMTQIGPFKRIILVNGKTINVDKFEIKYTLWIPENIAFNLKSKYNNIDIAPLKGKINFDLYDVDLTMAGYGVDAKLAMKYSNASIGSGGDAILDIYDSDIEALEMKNVEITSKYSEIIIKSVNTLDLNSYDDDIKLEKINSLKSEAKYSDFKIKGEVSNCFLNFYDSDIEASNIGTLIFSGKYSEIKAGNVNQFVVKTIYDSDVKLGEVGEFSCDDSKYDSFIFAGIKISVIMPSTFDSDLIVGKADPSFKVFEGNFKYCSIKLPLDASTQFSLEFETTYGEVNYPRERFSKNITSIKENSKHQFSGSTKENAPCSIKFTAYDSNVSF